MVVRNIKIKILMCYIILCTIISVSNLNSIIAEINGNLPVSYIDENFPASYMPYINAMKAKHPNWKFKAVHTGLDWNMALSHECYEVNEGISLVEDIYGPQWKWNGKDNYVDGNYVTASKEGVAYVMDPRNFINDQGIFQFEALSYVDGVQTVDAVQGVLAKTPMGSTYKDKYKLYGEWKDLGTTYAELIHKLCKQVGISPVHIASRIRQENSGDIINNPLINGSYGVYNFYNIGAYDTQNAGAIANGAAYAREHEWTSVSAALLGGITTIYNKYIQYGQNTIYFERFDVNNPGSGQWLLGTGYMTNIFGAKNEALMSYNAYNDIGMLDSGFEFHIPVYENMPEEVYTVPLQDEVTFTADNTIVYLDDPRDSGVTDEFWIRTGPDTDATILEKLYETRDGAENRTKFTRIGIGQNTLYDKIKYSDGRIGYILKSWVYEYSYVKVNSVSLNTTYAELSVGDSLSLNATISPSNALDKTVTWTSSNPDIATVDERGNVKAVGSGVVTITVKTNDQGKSEICTLNIKDTKVTSISLQYSTYSMHVGGSLTLTPTILPVSAKNKEYSITIANTNIAKVENKTIVGVGIGKTTATFTTQDGEKTTQVEIVVKSENDVTINLSDNLLNENGVISKIQPQTKVKDLLKEITTNAKVEIYNIGNNKLSDDDYVGTGSKIRFLKDDKIEEEYEVIVYGDIDGSGIINARDLLMLQRYIYNMLELESIQVKASIIDKTSEAPKAIDLLKIKRHILGMYVIEQ